MCSSSGRYGLPPRPKPPVLVSAFFSLQKAEAVNPFKAIPGIYDEEVAPVVVGGVRHWGDAIFFWGKTTPVYVV